MKWIICPFCRPEKLRSRMWLESHNGRGNVPTGSFHSQPMLWKALSLEEEESNGEKWGQSSKMWHPPFIQGWGCPGHRLDYSVVYWGLMPWNSRHSLITWLRWLQVPPANSWVSSAFSGDFPLGRERPELLHQHPGSLLCALPLWTGKHDLTYRPSSTMGSFWSSKDQAWDPLHQRSPTFLVPGTGFVEDNFSKDQGRGGWFRDDSSALHLLCTLFLLLLHQLHLRSSGIRSSGLGTPALDHKVLPPGKASLRPTLSKGEGAYICNACDSPCLPFRQSHFSNIAHDKSMSYKYSSWSMFQVHS